MSDNGWVKLYRNLNPVVLKDTDHLAVFTYLLIEANYQDASSPTYFGKEEIYLKKGQLITGRDKISKYFTGKRKCTTSKIQRILSCFESARLIEQRTTAYGRLITVVNYDNNFSSKQQSETQVNNKFTTNEQQSEHYQRNIYNNSNNKNERNKELKENNIINNITKEKSNGETKHIYGEYKHVRLTDKQYEKLQLDFPNEYEEMIKNLDEYLEMKNVSYKNHNLVMRNWKNKERKEKSSAKKEKKKDVSIDWLEEYL